VRGAEPDYNFHFSPPPRSVHVCPPLGGPNRKFQFFGPNFRPRRPTPKNSSPVASSRRAAYFHVLFSPEIRPPTALIRRKPIFENQNTTFFRTFLHFAPERTIRIRLNFQVVTVWVRGIEPYPKSPKKLGRTLRNSNLKFLMGNNIEKSLDPCFQNSNAFFSKTVH
jgi:hypothetical protein